MPQVTDWFPGNVTPTHIGVYERDWGDTTMFSLWNGVVWLMGGETPEDAEDKSQRSSSQSLPWRGLRNE